MTFLVVIGNYPFLGLVIYPLDLGNDLLGLVSGLFLLDLVFASFVRFSLVLGTWMIFLEILMIFLGILNDHEVTEISFYHVHHRLGLCY